MSTVRLFCLRVLAGAIVMTTAVDSGRARAGSVPETATPVPDLDTPTPTQTVSPTRSIRPISLTCEIVLDPMVPRVGDMVRVTIKRRSTGGGYPSYDLDTNPLFTGGRHPGCSSCFDLQAIHAGTTTLSGSTTDEFITGYSENGHPYYSFYSASCSKTVEVLEAGPTPTPVPGSPTPTFTPTSCVSDVPSVDLPVGSGGALRRTLRGFNRGLFCFRGGSISVSGDAEPLSVTVNCNNGSYTADILLSQPDANNVLTVCHHPGVCGSVGCRNIEIRHTSSRTVRVDTTADDRDQTPGDGICATAGGMCSLRAAIEEWTPPAGADATRIDLPPGTYTLGLIGTDDDFAATGDLDIHGDLIITGEDASATSIEGDATAAQRLFDVHDDGALYLSDLTIRGGRSQVGAGVRNTGFVRLERMTLSGNRAGAPDGSGGVGGAVWNRGRARLSEVSIDANSADAIDGIGTSRGGGVSNEGIMRIARSTISDNRAVAGGGLFNGGLIEVTNSTISGNSACCQGAGSGGGGVLNEGSLTLRSVTIAANAAVGGGSGLRGSASVAYTILAANPPTVRPDFTDNCGSSASVSSAGFNIDSDGTCRLQRPSDRVADPMLSPLAFAGGRTRTHALRPGSPAIDTAGLGDCPTLDQRGVARPMDGDGDGSAECDIGAFEFQRDIDADCMGDCDGDSVVRVHEVILAVNIALGNEAVEVCTAADGDGSGAVAVHEVVGGVGRLLNGCGGVESGR